MNSQTVFNVCFHGIGTPRRDLEPGEDRYWTTIDEFLRILDLIAKFHGPINLSFDDGNASDVEIGLAALLERELTATFFVLAGRLDRPGSIASTDLRTLQQHGMTIGTHGMDHRPWPGMDETTARRELVDARTAIAQIIGQPVDNAALPLGRYNRRVLRDLKSLGYMSVHTSDRRPARRGAWLQPRFSVRADDTASSVRSNVLRLPRIVQRVRYETIGLVKRYR